MTGPGASTGYDPLASVGGGSAPRPEPRIRMASPITGPEELEAIGAVLASGILTNGPATRRFEELMAERHGTRHGVALANGTVALAGMYLAAGIGPGDEVIVPSLTFIATATAVLHVGATPVFADVEPDTLNLDPDDVVRRITPRTRAVVPVHYGGQPAAMDRFVELGATHGIDVLEDAAQAHGAGFRGRPAGSWGRAAMFSFTPTKNITTGEGSVVTTDDDDLAASLRLLRNHGMSAQYHHTHLGYNWRLSELQSAMGCCQMERLDEILAAKRANAEAMAELLADVEGVAAPTVADGATHPYMIYALQVDAERVEAVTSALDEARIEWRRYFPPAHRQPIFAHVEATDLPVTDDVADRLVAIPFHARLQTEDLEAIARALRDAR